MYRAIIFFLVVIFCYEVATEDNFGAKFRSSLEISKRNVESDLLETRSRERRFVVPVGRAGAGIGASARARAKAKAKVTASLTRTDNDPNESGPGWKAKATASLGIGMLARARIFSKVGYSTRQRIAERRKQDDRFFEEENPAPRKIVVNSVGGGPTNGNDFDNRGNYGPRDDYNDHSRGPERSYQSGPSGGPDGRSFGPPRGYNEPSGRYDNPSGRYDNPSGRYENPSGGYNKPSGTQPGGESPNGRIPIPIPEVTDGGSSSLSSSLSNSNDGATHTDTLGLTRGSGTSSALAGAAGHPISKRQVKNNESGRANPFTSRLRKGMAIASANSLATGVSGVSNAISTAFSNGGLAFANAKSIASNGGKSSATAISKSKSTEETEDSENQEADNGSSTEEGDSPKENKNNNENTSKSQVPSNRRKPNGSAVFRGIAKGIANALSTGAFKAPFFMSGLKS